MASGRIPVPEAELAGWLGGATVLVTGGTGCVGSALMAQAARWRPRRLVSVSRGLTGGWPRLAGAEYFRADIRDPRGLAAVFDEVRPDVVFHLAAQRDPGLAEDEVHRTVTTNVLGTRQVICAAEEHGVRDVVFASTGKALRPYSREVYTASKRAAEWLIAGAALRGQARYSAARFTARGRQLDHRPAAARWSAGGVIRLHAADIMFYAQSALESAQLLLAPGSARAAAACGRTPSPTWAGRSACSTSRSGCWPAPAPRHRSTSAATTPATRACRSPACTTRDRRRGEPAAERVRGRGRSRCAGRVTDAFPVRFTFGPQPDAPLRALQDACVAGDAATVRAALDTLSWVAARRHAESGAA